MFWTGVGVGTGDAGLPGALGEAGAAGEAAALGVPAPAAWASLLKTLILWRREIILVKCYIIGWLVGCDTNESF